MKLLIFAKLKIRIAEIVIRCGSENDYRCLPIPDCRDLFMFPTYGA